MIQVFKTRHGVWVAKEDAMRQRAQNDSGVILVLVLMVLSLLGIVGLTFGVYAADVRCRQNPNVQISGETCTQTIGNDRR
jgi:hypothetical protein